MDIRKLYNYIEMTIRSPIGLVLAMCVACFILGFFAGWWAAA